MSPLTTIFKWLLVKSKCTFVHSTSFDAFYPFRVMETRIDDDRTLKFSIMKDRRQHRIPCVSQTFLVRAEIHRDLPEKLQEYNDIQLLTVNVFGSVFFTNEIISNVLLNMYLDKIIYDLKQ